MMVNTRSDTMDNEDTLCASLPNDPSRDDTLPSHISTQQKIIGVDANPPSPVGSEIWMPTDDNAQKNMHAVLMYRSGVRPQEILSFLFPHIQLPNRSALSSSAALKILSDIVDKPPKRAKLPQYNTFQDAVDLFKKSKRILMLTGAGVSVSCGIPDFRSKDGIYARLHESFPDLPDPSAMFDIQYFRKNPKPFYNFAKEIFPGMFEPSFSHKFIRQLEKKDKLLRNYSQNIDTLEKVANIERVIECHGSFSSATCLDCKAVYSPDDIKEHVMDKTVAMCTKCKVGVIKPDIVFFGEDLHADFHQQMAIDKDLPDLLVVIGSSLKVRPVSLIPFAVPSDCPQILINREPIPHYTPDMELLGNCDDILREIAIRMGEEEFVKDYDKSHGRDDSESLTMRRLVLKDEVDKIFDKINEEEEKKIKEEEEREEYEKKKIEEKVRQNEIKNKEEDEEENKEEDDLYEPMAKRSRNDTDRHPLAGMYSPRYVSVESHIPEGSFMEISTNQYVFPGAEIYLDLETKVISQLPSRRLASGCCMDSDCDSDNDSDEDDERSLPSQPFSEPTPSCQSPISPRPRSNSCLPSLDIQSLTPSHHNN